MWRRGLHARGGIHKPERPFKSQPAGECGSAQARPSKMLSIRRFRKELLGKDCTTKEIQSAEVDVLPMCGSASTAVNTLAIPRGSERGHSVGARCFCDAHRHREELDAGALASGVRERFRVSLHGAGCIGEKAHSRPTMLQPHLGRAEISTRILRMTKRF